MPDTDDCMPLVNPSVLNKLKAELEDDEGLWRVFIQNFIKLLPARTEKLRHTLTTGDPDGAKDAILSLKTSSHMAGAERLASFAQDLELSLKHDLITGDPALVLPRLAAAHFGHIKECAETSAYVLQRYLDRQSR